MERIEKLNELIVLYFSFSQLLNMKELDMVITDIKDNYLIFYP